MSSPHGAARARAHANIALIKYWGKRDRARNLPAAGSLSLTLAALTTTTSVRFDPALAGDRLVLDHRVEDGKALARVSAWLDLVRAQAGIDTRAEVVSANDFPTASGLASSASAYAALALAATRAAGLTLDQRALSILARRGSGSAARSIYGGFVRMHAGARDDGSDAYAEALDEAGDWPLRMVVAVVGGGQKKTHGSRDAMEHCAATSPLYAGWLSCVPGDLDSAARAIAARDFDALGQVSEANALAMHAAALASRPAIVYWQPATLACLSEVRALRERGVGAYATMDAGPHVKVLTRADDAEAVAAAMRSVPGVSDIITSTSGGGARVLEADGAGA
ncbi:diphosphomevalonate decarboxylase [Haliangium ochraceum]|uniref:diphosphomevalonate decarboxylase n=1 Tax=Haliangium ochraceum (strain DSM 14365 / JCM 11303 / SMP-2) TaxID=502025 RepID=D0LV69_HALO1|nr:diphosphomevalonate decarboxylase [Haliangium ochraceum]ACY15910.1 diphosphomevalonate decarboxylase [Haliangium ochraceum DSM 14365]